MYDYSSYYMDAEFEAPKCTAYKLSKVAFCRPKLNGKPLSIAYILAVNDRYVTRYLKRHIDKLIYKGLRTCTYTKVPVYKVSKDEMWYEKGSIPVINLTVVNKVRKVVLEEV